MCASLRRRRLPFTAPATTPGLRSEASVGQAVLMKSLTLGRSASRAFTKQKYGGAAR